VFSDVVRGDLSLYVRLYPRFPVTTVIPSIVPLITCFRKSSYASFDRFTQLTFLLFVACTIFHSSLTMYQFFVYHMIGPADLLHPFPAPHFRTFHVFLIFVCCRILNSVLSTWSCDQSRISRKIVMRKSV
jgi:hypothetical protein